MYETNPDVKCNCCLRKVEAPESDFCEFCTDCKARGCPDDSVYDECPLRQKGETNEQGNQGGGQEG